MKTQNNQRTSASTWAVPVLAVLSLGLATVAPAANFAWSTAPANGNFGGNNWTSGAVPGTAATTPVTASSLFFGTSTLTTLTNNDSAFTFAGITFNSGANAFTINSNAFTLTGGITNSSISLQTINAPVALSGANSVAGGGNVTLGGIVSGTGTLAMSGTGVLALTGANTYSGATTVSSGELDISNWGASGLAAITVGNTATTAILGVKGGTLALGANTFTIGSGISSSFIGTVNQTAGTVSFTGGTAMLMGNGTNTVANYNLSGGTLSSGTYSVNNRGVILGVNSGCSGTFNLSGSGVLSLPFATLEVGRSDAAATGGVAAFNQTGGTATLGYLTLGGYSGAGATAATLSLTGGSFVATNFPIFVGAANSSATLTLGSSAQVTLPAFPAPVGTANLTLDFTTGYLAPVASSLNYLNGLTHAYLTANGANFNVPAGINIAVGQSFQNASSQTGVLTKSGAGILKLSGISTYTGATTVTAGELVGVTGGSVASSAVSVTPAAGAATLGIYYAGTNGQWTASSLAFNTGGTGTGLEFAFGATPSTTVAPLAVTGSLTFNSTPTVTVDPANLVSGTSYPLLVVGGTVPATGVPTTANIGRGLTGTLAWGTGAPYSANTLVLTVAGTATSPLSWGSSTAGNWDANDTTNLVWKDSSSPTPLAAYYQDTGLTGDQVVFSDNNIAANTTVTLIGSVAPASVTFNTTNYTYTVSGTGGITGPVALTKNGTGAVTLSTPNTYAGGTVINQGTVNTGVAAGLGTSPVSIASGAALNLTVAGVTYAGPNAGISGAGAVNVTTGSGSSSVPLNGTNSGFTGVVNVGTNSTGGKIQLQGPLAASATVNILSNATVYIGTAVTNPASAVLYGGTPGETLGQLRIEGSGVWSGPVTLAGPILGAANGTVGANSGSGYITGNIGQTGGAQSLIKVGGGSVILAGANTYTGGTAVNVGTLTLLGNQTGVTGGIFVGTNTAAAALNIGSGTQTASTAIAVSATGTNLLGNTVQVQTGASQYDTINVTGTNGFPTYVTNNGPLQIGRDSGFALNGYSYWYQNTNLTVAANGGYGATLTIYSNASLTYAGVNPIAFIPGNANANGSATLNVTGGSLITGQGFTFTTATSGSYNRFMLQNSGQLIFSGNVPALTAGDPNGQFQIGTNATINTAGYGVVMGTPIANISGQAGSLIKTGAGTLELDAANTYTGATTISGGTLLLGASASLATTAIILTNNATLDVSAPGSYNLAATVPLSGSGTVVGAFYDNAGSQIYPGANGPVGALSFTSNLNLAGGDFLNFDFSNGGSNDVINVGGILNSAGVTTINLAKWPLASGFAIGNYVLIQATNGLTGNAANFTLANAPGRQNCSIVINTIGALQQVVLVVGQSGSPANLVWQGGQNGNAWDVQATANWLNTNTPDYFFSGDNVTFSNVPADNAAVNLAVTVTPGSVVFASTNSYLISSGSGYYISGVTAVTQNGPGTVALATLNDYSGGTVINGGVLQLGDGITLPGSVAGIITNNATLLLANPYAQTLTNNIRGSGSFLAAGSGTLTVSGNNNYTGGTLVSNGVFQAASSTALGAPTAGVAAIVDAGADLDFHIASAYVLTNMITGAGAVSQSATTALTLTGTNTFTGGLTVNAGAVYVANNNAVGTGPILIDNQGSGIFSQLFLKNGITISNAITIATASSYYQGILMVDSGTYGYGGANGSGTASDTNGATFAGPITLAPGTVGHGGQICGPIGGTNFLYINGPVTNTGGTVVTRNGRVRFSGGGDYAVLNVGGGTGSIGIADGLATNASLNVSAASSFDLNGFNQTLTGLTSGGAANALLTNSAATPATLTLDLSANSSYYGSIGGNITLVENGSAVLNLANTNSYTGNTTVNGGTLELAQPSINTNSTVTLAGGATLQLDFTGVNTVAALVLNGVSQPAGIYDSTTAAPYITGTGALQIGSAIASNPTNMIFTVTGNTGTLTWPADHLGWLVQSNSISLTVPADWQDISNTAAMTNYSFTIDPAKVNVFYRLRHP